MSTLFYNPSQIVSVDTNGKNFKSGKELQEIFPLSDSSIVVENGKIKKIIKTAKAEKNEFDEVIDLTGKLILPGLVEAHTHLVFAGNRSDEFGMRLNGISYEEIAKKGGGINSTVQSVRNSSFEELLNLAKPRVENFIQQGVTTLEIKSGYGLSFYDEIKILEVIQELNKIFPITIIPTFLGAHTFPPEYNNDKQQYLDILIKQVIPYAAEKKLAEFCDGFCEATAFSSKQINEIFEAAKQNGLKLKLHTDQFNSIGGIDVALNNEAISVDHLEVIDDEQINKISNNDICSVLLPGVSYTLQYSYAPARKLIDNGATVALATDYNPGSSHISNISLIWGLAALNMKMTPEEIISAYTINAAKALAISENVGSIEKNKDADFTIFEAKDYSDLVYNTGNNLCSATVKSGKVIYEKK